MKVMKKGKRPSHSGEKKKNKRNREQNPDVEIIVATQNGNGKLCSYYAFIFVAFC